MKPIVLLMKSLSRFFFRGILPHPSLGQLPHTLRAFLQCLRLLFGRLCSTVRKSCCPVYQSSYSCQEGYTIRPHSLPGSPPCLSEIAHVKPQDVMAGPEKKPHSCSNESVHAPRDPVESPLNMTSPGDLPATNMSSLLPMFHQPSALVPVNGPSGRNVISSPDGRLNISPMSAEGIQELRYYPGNQNPM